MKVTTCLVLGVVAITAIHVDAQESNSTDCSTFNCDNDFAPVCASNDITYWNECWLEFADCESPDDITEAHEGGCTTTGSASSLAADNEGPFESHGVANCTDVVCPMIYMPVCGSDGATYGNGCLLGVTHCESGGAITHVSDGECPGPAKCPDVCTLIYTPVCGSDGVTYGNDCTLGIAQCESDGAITKVSDGECPSRCPELCIEIFKPVCGSDGVTYANSCFLDMAACKDPSITQVREGSCATPEGSPYPHESCK